MKAGDKVESVTKALGIKSCSGCQKRKGLLNRRGLLGTAFLGAFLAKDFFVRKGWELAAAELPPLEPWFALGFFRQAMAAQRSEYMFNHHQLGKINLIMRVMEHREHFPVDSTGYAWMSVLTPAGPQTLPGWTLDVLLTTKGYPRQIAAEPFDSGFRMSLRGPKYTFIADEGGLVYRVDNPTKPIDLTNVSEAKSVPGAVNIGEIHDEDVAAHKPTIMELISDFFVPKAYASCILCTSCCESSCCCYKCGCLSCLTKCTDCCGTGYCSDIPGNGECYFHLGCATCTYYNFACGSSDCLCCAQLFGDCCTPAAGCEAGCGTRCGHRC